MGNFFFKPAGPPGQEFLVAAEGHKSRQSMCTLNGGQGGYSPWKKGIFMLTNLPI